MGLLDDVLNGGIDRDCDGDIDSHDRDLYFEECIRNDELEKAEIYCQQSEEWVDFYDEIDDEDYDSIDDLDSDIEDDITISCVPTSYNTSVIKPYCYSIQEEKDNIMLGLPIYKGNKGKEDKEVIEWENMPEDKVVAAKKWYKVFIGSLFVFCLGIVLAIIIPIACYEVIDDIAPFIFCGIMVGIVGFILLVWSGSHHTELTLYYTRVVGKNGVLKYRSQYSVDKALKDIEEKMNVKK